MRLPLSMTAALIGAGLLALPAPANAVPLGGAISRNLMSQAQADGNSLVIQVQRRRGGGGGGGGHRRDDRRRGGVNSGAVAAGILGGLLLGAIIANEAQRSRSVEYCMRRYRSYDPRSGTYLGYDGYRHRCP